MKDGTMPISKLRPSFTLTEDRLRELQAVVPEAFADGRINWDTLREALGETLEDETKEHFGLFWPGKREARRLAALPSKGTLIPQPGAGVDEESTHNVFIEGDNLEVLKLLQKSYAGRVKMIYIDPPYNTGNDFVYPDDYSEPLDAYLQRTGQADEAGKLLTTNSRASGRFHSIWLSMMLPRLILARQLLRKDGMIFVSIDDNEVHNLRLILNEVFGDEHFVAVFPWKKRTAKSDVPFGVSQDYEWIVCYAKDEFSAGIEHDRKYFQTDDIPNDRWRLSDLTTQRSAKERPNSAFSMIDPKTKKSYPFNPKRVWGVTRDTFQAYYDKGKIVFPDDYEFLNISIPAYRVFESEDKQKALKKYGSEFSMKAISTHLPIEVGMNEDGNKEIVDFFGKKIFSFPKPTSLIKYLLSVINDDNDECIILDFFAGSSTTAHAILELNRKDDGHRKFIMVQLPEPFEGNYKNLAELSRERIRRVSARLKKGKHGILDLSPNEDLGFRSFALSQSSFSDWQSYEGKDTSQLELRLAEAETPLVEGWTPDDLLAEVLLLQGFPLDSRVRVLPGFKQNEVKQVTSEFVGHDLFVCLDMKVEAETVGRLSLRAEDILVCLDSALSDEAKVNLADRCNLKVI